MHIDPNESFAYTRSTGNNVGDLKFELSTLFLHNCSVEKYTITRASQTRNDDQARS